MRENYFYFSKGEKIQGKNMREAWREERTDFLFYSSEFALWLRMIKWTELPIIFITLLLLLLNAGNNLFKGAKRFFSPAFVHFRKISFEVFVVIHTDGKQRIFKSNSVSSYVVIEAGTYCQKVFIYYWILSEPNRYVWLKCKIKEYCLDVEERGKTSTVFIGVTWFHFCSPPFVEEIYRAFFFSFFFFCKQQQSIGR